MVFPLDSKDELEEHIAKSIACLESQKDTTGSQIDEQAKMEGAKRKRKGVNQNTAEVKKSSHVQSVIS